MSNHEMDSASSDNFSELRSISPLLTEAIEAILELGLELKTQSVEYPDLAYYITRYVRDDPDIDVEPVRAPLVIVAQGIMLYMSSMMVSRTSLLIPGDPQRVFMMDSLPNNIRYHLRVAGNADSGKPARGLPQEVIVSRIVQHRAADGTTVESATAPPGFKCVTTPLRTLFGPMNHVVAIGSVSISAYN